MRIRRISRPRHAQRRLSVLTALATGVLLTAGPGGTAVAGTGARAGRAFGGTSAIGALFTQKKGRLGSHFCTASVVHSPKGNLLITAAHCVADPQPRRPGSFVFAPGYHKGKFPHGIWRVTTIYVDKTWAAQQDANDDVAFLVAGPPGSSIEKHTGAEVLLINQKLPVQAMVIGYPNSTSQPIRCTAPARSFDPGKLRQLKFHCGGYTNGTSGGPFLVGVSAKTGNGKVVGVIGGYQQGGNTPSISYSSKFLANILKLYKVAAATRAAQS